MSIAFLAGKSDVDPQHRRLLEAILFASAEPLSESAIAERMPEGADIAALLVACLLYTSRCV